MTTAENLPQKKSDGTIIYPTITSLPPPEVLPHLHASDTIKGQLKVVNSETGQVETATQPAIVFVQKAKDAIQRHTLQNDIRYQVGLWFQEGKRAEFVKQLYLDAYEQMYRKKLSVLLIDASDQKTVVPEEKHVRVVKIKDFKKLQSIVGIATMQQVARLPSKLDNLWFPLILLHPHTREEKQDGSTKTNQWLNTCTYTSFVLIPYPNSLSGETWEFQKDQIQGTSVDPIKSHRLEHAVMEYEELLKEYKFQGTRVALSVAGKTAKTRSKSTVYLMQYANGQLEAIQRDGQAVVLKSVKNQEISLRLAAETRQASVANVQPVVSRLEQSQSEIKAAIAEAEMNPTTEALTHAANTAVAAASEAIATIAQATNNQPTALTETLQEKISQLQDAKAELQANPNNMDAKHTVAQTIQTTDSTLAENAQSVEENGIEFEGFYKILDEWQGYQETIYDTDSDRAAKSLYKLISNQGVAPDAIAVAYQSSKDYSVYLSIWNVRASADEDDDTIIFEPVVAIVAFESGEWNAIQSVVDAEEKALKTRQELAEEKAQIPIAPIPDLVQQEDEEVEVIAKPKKKKRIIIEEEEEEQIVPAEIERDAEEDKGDQLYRYYSTDDGDSFLPVKQTAYAPSGETFDQYIEDEIRNLWTELDTAGIEPDQLTIVIRKPNGSYRGETWQASEGDVEFVEKVRFSSNLTRIYPKPKKTKVQTVNPFTKEEYTPKQLKQQAQRKREKAARKQDAKKRWAAIFKSF